MKMGDSIYPKGVPSPSSFQGLEQHGKDKEQGWHAKYGGTLADQADMGALGRKQELRVWVLTSQDATPDFYCLTDADEAKFPVHFYRWVWLHSDCNVGGDPDVRSALSLSDAAERFN